DSRLPIDGLKIGRRVSMTPFVFVWPYALVFWVVYAWAFFPEFRIVWRGLKTDRKGAASQDARSMQVIVLGMWIGLGAAFPLAHIARFAFTGAARAGAFWAGTALLVAGSLLRRHCWRVLGEYFTGNVQTVSGQRVIDRGAYCYVRHPSYTAGIMMFLGIGIALGSWLSALVTLLSSAGVYAYRVGIEERALASALGQPYIDYMKTRKRFVPFVI
ncbi:MAG TPA: isoprenylcysteine carboxylmethyltransferase family protein, partial [Vicinamibacterales bacterium]|nr:isoprenylcysteine carboxylmethyltransferase family protein [Vicinamibacterales bacterium]